MKVLCGERGVQRLLLPNRAKTPSAPPIPGQRGRGLTRLFCKVCPSATGLLPRTALHGASGMQEGPTASPGAGSRAPQLPRPEPCTHQRPDLCQASRRLPTPAKGAPRTGRPSQQLPKSHAYTQAWVVREPSRRFSGFWKNRPRPKQSWLTGQEATGVRRHGGGRLGPPGLPRRALPGHPPRPRPARWTHRPHAAGHPRRDPSGGRAPAHLRPRR